MEDFHLGSADSLGCNRQVSKGQMSNHSIPDRELLERIAQSQDQEAKGVLFERYAADVRDAIARKAPNGCRIDPDDVCQEVFMKLFTSPGSFIDAASSPAALVNYLKVAAWNKFLGMTTRRTLDRLSNSMSELESLGVELGGPPPESPINAELLADSLALLDHKDSQLVVGHFLKEVSYHELAEIHGEASSESVRKRIARALEKVREHLVAKGVTSSSLADEIRILNMPPPAWRGVPKRQKTSTLGRARLGVLVVAVLVVLFLPQRYFYDPSVVIQQQPTNEPAPGAAQIVLPIAAMGSAPIIQPPSLAELRRVMAGNQPGMDIALTPTGGLQVWQTVARDGDGLGICSRLFDKELGKQHPIVSVNLTTKDDQEAPAVAPMRAGGYIVVWQDGRRGSQKIIARIASNSGEFESEEIEVSLGGDNARPDIAVLESGSIVVAWSAWGADRSGYAVQFRALTESGSFLSDSAVVNEFTEGNQRDPSIATLADGGFVIAWVSEGQALTSTAKSPAAVYAKAFNQDGSARTRETLLVAGDGPSASPAVIGIPKGFLAVWSQSTPMSHPAEQRWQLQTQVFGPSCQASGNVKPLNENPSGFQIGPRLTVVGSAILATYRSDRRQFEVSGQLLDLDGNVIGLELSSDSPKKPRPPGWNGPDIDGLRLPQDLSLDGW